MLPQERAILPQKEANSGGKNSEIHLSQEQEQKQYLE